MSEHDTARDAALSRLYRESATAEPAAHLDEAILAAARGAAARAPKARPWAWWRGWLVPVSVAAVAVVSLTLTLQVPREMEQAEREAAPAKRDRMSAPAPERAAPAAADAAAPAAGHLAQPVPPPPPSLRWQEKAHSGAPPRGASKPRAAFSAERAAERREAFAPEPRAAVGAMQSPAEPAALGSGLEAPAMAPTAAAPFASQRRLPSGRADAPPSPAEGAAFAPAPTLSGSAQEARKHLAPSLTADEDMPKNRAAEPRPPALWLEEIRTLLRHGRTHEAAEGLAAFRRAYPDYVLPLDLRALPPR